MAAVQQRENTYLKKFTKKAQSNVHIRNTSDSLKDIKTINVHDCHKEEA